MGFKISETRGFALVAAAVWGRGSGVFGEPVRDCGGGEGAKEERYDLESRADGWACRIDKIRSYLSVTFLSSQDPLYHLESLLVDYDKLFFPVDQYSPHPK